MFYKKSGALVSPSHDCLGACKHIAVQPCCMSSQRCFLHGLSPSSLFILHAACTVLCPTPTAITMCAPPTVRYRDQPAYLNPPGAGAFHQVGVYLGLSLNPWGVFQGMCVLVEMGEGRTPSSCNTQLPPAGRLQESMCRQAVSWNTSSLS